MSYKIAAIASIAVTLVASSAAYAQKSADTLRIAINDMFPLVDPYNYPQDEQASFSQTVYQGLINFDERNGKYVANLAHAWRRIDERTLEFEIRNDIKFHNGEALSAEDFKATYEWLIDEKTRIRFKENYNWIDHVELLDRYKMRIHIKRINQGDLARIAYGMRVLNKKALESLENATEYGRLAPYGTGPYKVVSIDKTKGVVVERFDGYRNDPDDYFRAPVKRVHGIPVPERQAQQAMLMTGGLDLVRNVPADSAKDLANVPNLAVTATSSAILLYANLDAAGRSANKALKDERVRKAFIMSIDRPSLVKNMVPAGDMAAVPDGICFKTMLACGVSTKPYSYNPAEAKRLLAEAGYANGLDITLYAHEPVAYIATAMAGELRKAGFRANVEALPNSVLVKRRGDGELSVMVSFFPTGSLPDTAYMLNFFLGQDRDYWQNQQITDVWTKGESEQDLARRTALYKPALDMINEKAYFLPISELPTIWAHSKDVKVLPNMLTTADPRLGDYAWSDYQPKQRK